jgi:hypothetical protein
MTHKLKHNPFLKAVFETPRIWVQLFWGCKKGFVARGVVAHFQDCLRGIIFFEPKTNDALNHPSGIVLDSVGLP